MLIRDDLVRRLENDRLAAFMMAAAGAEGVQVPDVEEELERFDVALNEPPRVMSPVDSAKAELRRALGLSATPERARA